jgi:hypothetical protein
MRVSLFRLIAASLAALALGFSVSTTPASAGIRMGGGGGGFHGGGGGWHGGGSGGGGWHGGGWGYRGYGGWGYGGWGWGGYGDYGDYDAGYGYGPDYGYVGDPNPACVHLKPVYDRHGHYLGRRYIDVCR